MTDYTRSTGSSGTMMIRDTGSVVEFWIKAGSSTYAYKMPWGFTVNGVTDNSNTFRFESGGSWQKVRSWTVTTNQTVTFRLGDTGTSGLGGPTTLNAYINRASVPNAPASLTIGRVTSNSIDVTFTDGANNGSAIDQRQIGWATVSSGPVRSMASDGSTTIIGLTPGTTYYVWARSHNALGWGPWGGRKAATTLKVPDAPSTVVLSSVGQVSVYAKFTANGNGGSPILEYEIGYGINATTPTNTVPSNGGTTVTGLAPGTKYYFWARARNTVGWGPWSAVAGTATTIGGCLIKVGAVYKPAIPYVKVAGVWKVMRPWGRIFGIWKESS